MTIATTAPTLPAIRANALHILIAASMMMSLAMGMRQCLGLFLSPITQALGMSASDFTFAIAVQNVVWGLAQAPLGAAGDRWGLRPVMVMGAMAYVAAMATMTVATDKARRAGFMVFLTLRTANARIMFRTLKARALKAKCMQV